MEREYQNNKKDAKKNDLSMKNSIQTNQKNNQNKPQNKPQNNAPAKDNTPKQEQLVQARTQGEKRYVDTRASNVDLDKFDTEKIEERGFSIFSW